MHPTMSQVITDCNKGYLKLKHDGEIVNLIQGSTRKACEYALNKYINAKDTSSFGMIAFTNDECKAINSYLDNSLLEKLGLTRDKYDNCPNYVGRRVLSKDNVKKYKIAKNNIFTIKAMAKNSTVFELVDGSRIEIPNDDLPELATAWCCTVHSYQGSEVDEMFVAVNSDKVNTRYPAGRFRSNRNNTIVAMSRAKKVLTVIDISGESHEDGLQYALVNHEMYYSPKKKYECKSF